MVHGGIGSDTQLENALGRDPRCLVQVCQNGDQGLLDNGILKLFPPAGLPLLNDPVDDVCTVTDLSIAAGALGHNFTSGHLCQNRRDCGGANVNGGSVESGILGTGNVQHRKPVPFQQALDRNLEAKLPQGACQLDHDGIRQIHLLHTRSLLNGPDQPFVIGHGIVQSGLRQGNGQNPEAGLKGNSRCLHILLNGCEQRHLFR